MIELKVDAVMITKDSYLRHGEIFIKALQSIKDNVPLGRVIVVDSGEDETQQIIKEYFNECLVIRSKVGRGKAREIGIKAVETELFCFFDDDVILCEKWFEKIVKYLNHNVEAIWGLAIPADPHELNTFKLRRIIRDLSLQDFLIHLFESRGGLLHDTLVRTEVVKGITIPDIHTYEDRFIVNFIRSKRYLVLPAKDVTCLHYKAHPKWSMEEGLREAMSMIKCGLYQYNWKNFILSTKAFLTSIPESLAIALLTGDLKAAEINLKSHYFTWRALIKLSKLREQNIAEYL